MNIVTNLKQNEAQRAGAESTQRGVNWRSKYITQVQQQRPEWPTLTLTWHACKYKVHTGFLTSNNVQGLKLPFALAQDVSPRYRDKKKKKMFLLLYADDSLQRALDMLKIYCEVWGLDINVRITQVMIF